MTGLVVIKLGVIVHRYFELDVGYVGATIIVRQPHLQTEHVFPGDAQWKPLLRQCEPKGMPRRVNYVQLLRLLKAA